MLAKTRYKKLYRNKFPGVALAATNAGKVVRRVGQPVNPNTPAQSRWRQIMVAHKQQWAAIASGSLNGGAGFGSDPQGAWAACAETYVGILLSALILENEASTPTMRGVLSTEAYYTMVNNNRASLGLPTLPTPGTSTVQIAVGTPPAAVAVNGGNFSAAAKTPRTTGPLAAYATYAWSGTPTSPTSFTVEITAAASGLTALLMDTWDTTATYTLGPDVTLNSWLTVFIPSTTAPGTYNVTLKVTSGSDQATYTLPFVVSSPNTLAAEEGVVFTLPAYTADQDGNESIAVSISTRYDDSYKLDYFAFDWTTEDPHGALAYTAASVHDGSSGNGSGAVPCLYAVTASDVYTDSYSPPSSSTWKPIGYTCPINGVGEFHDWLYLTQSNGLRKLWENTYGTLPSKGNIKFQFTPVDPDTGASGPSGSCTAKWENGTLKGQPIRAWYGAQFNVALWGPLEDATSITGNGPYTLHFPYGKFNDQLTGVLYYSNTPGSTPVYGPCSYSTPDTQTMNFTVPSGAPAPTLSSEFFWAYTKAHIAAPGSTAVLIQLNAPLYPSGNPAGPWFPYSGTITPKAKAGAYVTTGTPPKYRALPKGVTFAISPATVTIDTDDHAVHWAIAKITAPSLVQAFDDRVGISCTDSIQTSRASFTLHIDGDTTAAPPQNYLTANPQQQNYKNTGPSQTSYAYTAENTGPDDIDVSLYASSNDQDLTFQCGPGASAAATATAKTITFALATGAEDDSLVGGTLTTTGYAPSGYNLTDATIVANDASTITVTSKNNPGAMTTQGIATLTSTNAITVPKGTASTPGTASFAVVVTIPAAQTMPLTFTQVELDAGNNTCYCECG